MTARQGEMGNTDQIRSGTRVGLHLPFLFQRQLQFQLRVQIFLHVYPIHPAPMLDPDFPVFCTHFESEGLVQAHRARVVLLST